MASLRNIVLPVAGRTRGFTLVELITVIVVLGVLAALGSSFVVSAIDSYFHTQERSRLVNRGRQALEQMVRQLRDAAPNSVRVSASGNCIEFLPTIVGGYYQNLVPDQSNGAPPVATIKTSPLTLTSVTPRYVLIAPLSAGEIYSSAPASLALYGNLNTAVVPNNLTLTSSKRWQRNSVANRIYLADYPRQFCVTNNELRLYKNYTGGGFPSSSALAATPPNTGSLMSQRVDSSSVTPFAVSAATQTRNTLIDITLAVGNARGEQVVLRQQVMVRNVP